MPSDHSADDIFPVVFLEDAVTGRRRASVDVERLKAAALSGGSQQL